MGIPMDDLHTPTVPSGPTTQSQANGTRLQGLSLAELVAAKDNLEAELKALGGVLDSVRKLYHQQPFLRSESDVMSSMA